MVGIKPPYTRGKRTVSPNFRVGPDANRVEAAPVAVHPHLDIMIIQIYAAESRREHLSSFMPFEKTQNATPQPPFVDGIESI